MNNSMFGLIYTGEANAQLRELTFSRSVAAVPFGGRTVPSILCFPIL